MEYIFIPVLSYLIGSFPTAYVIYRVFLKKDITKMGTGNVGAMNAYESSGSKLIGIIVFLIDFIKGFLPVSLVSHYFPGNFILVSFSMLFPLLGHCFSVWIKFKGGRGLATALGGNLLFQPLIALTWCLLWVLFFSWSKDIHKSNNLSTIITQLFGYIFISTYAKYSYPAPENLLQLFFVIFFCMNLILLKHFKTLKSLFRNTNINI